MTRLLTWAAPKTSFSQVVLAFLSITFVRIVLEYLLEADHAIEPFPSYLLLFLFYAVVFGGAVVTLSYFSRMTLSKAAATAVFFYPLVWLAPILDFVISGGKGYALMFAFHSSFWDAFTTFFGSVIGISPGIRIELVVIILTLAAVVYFRTKSLWRSFCAVWVYYVFLVVNVMPHSLFQGLFGYPTENLFLYREVLGLYAVFLTGLALYFLHHEKPALWKSFVSHLHPTRVVHYLGLVAFGMVLGSSLWMHPFPGAYFPIVATFLTVFFAFEAALCINDYFDFSMDAKTRPNRRPPGTALELAFWFGVLALINALVVGYVVVVLLLFYLGLAWVYSAPPLRLRRHFLFASLILAACSLCVFWMGFVSGTFSQEEAIGRIPFAYQALIFGLVFLGSPLKDLKEIAADKAGKIATIPTIFPKHGLVLTAAMVVIAALWGGYFASLPWFAGPLFGAVGAGVLLFVKNPALRDRYVFLVHYGFIFVIAAWLFGFRIF